MTAKVGRREYFLLTKYTYKSFSDNFEIWPFLLHSLLNLKEATNT